MRGSFKVYDGICCGPSVLASYLLIFPKMFVCSLPSIKPHCNLSKFSWLSTSICSLVVENKSEVKLMV